MGKKFISRKLFDTYTLFFVVIFTCVILLFTVFFVVTINSQIVKTQKQMIHNIAQNIENYFRDINDFSLKLINNKEFKSIAIEEMPEEYEKDEEHSESFKKLYQISYEMFQKNYKIGVYTKSEYYTWMGNNFFFNKSNDHTLDDFVDYTDSGELHVLRDETNAFIEALATSALYKEELKESIVLWRTMNINNTFGKGQAILQVEADAEEFDDYIKSLSDNSNINKMNIIIANKESEILYSEGNVDLIESSDVTFNRSGEYRVKGYIINVKHILDGNVFVMFVAPMWSYYTQIVILIIITIIGSIIAILTIMFISFKLSKRFSDPIKKIISQVEDLDTDNFRKVETEIYELDFLAETIAKLHENLDDSIRQIVDLKAAELQSKMLALQAQMQPHFLYNVLTTVSAIAEENGVYTASNMCKSLTNMLRYISTEKEDGVTVFEEIKHLNNYVDIMKERFLDATINIDVPLELMDKYVPKLIIQPIVENSFKHSDKSNLEIHVKGFIVPNGFYFDIYDNGVGFQEGDIELVKRKCKEITEMNNELSINGMGIPNIYLRLKMFFKEGLIFEMKNDSFGACVRIGMKGKIDG